MLVLFGYIMDAVPVEKFPNYIPEESWFIWCLKIIITVIKHDSDLPVWDLAVYSDSYYSLLGYDTLYSNR